ncbi:rhodanese-like domain-containing protein, partial [Komagataeibacter kakiaceti]|uniref:rhodanese-like domain-containing protein n=1 Tax=Komagataeibacter kakiaceti TaxID=943261 RepID=UPI00241276AB
MHPLISASDLARAIQQDNILVLDASMALPGQSFDPQQRFANAHIANAVRFDIDTFSDPDSTLPHTIPGQARFTRLASERGMANDRRIVFYDQDGMACAARGWWLASLFGHGQVQVLEGGLPHGNARACRWKPGRIYPPRPRSSAARTIAACGGWGMCWPSCRDTWRGWF